MGEGAPRLIEDLEKGIKFLLAGLPPEEFKTEGAKAAALLKKSPLWARYKTILLFLSMPKEIDTSPILEAAFDDGKQVFAPRTEDALIRFYRVSSPRGPWQYGFFGMREPAEPAIPAELMIPAEPEGAKEGEDALQKRDFPALVITPGLAFDRQGRRLGRGGGYYERFFAELDQAGRDYCAIGLCMECQLVDEVPAEEFDKKVNALLTASEYEEF